MESSNHCEPAERCYHWYVLGCEQLGWIPLLETDFLNCYERLHRCERVVFAYWEKSGDNEFWLQQGFAETLRLDAMLKSVRQEINRLAGIDRAVLTGKRLDGEGGTAVGVCLQPVPPVLTGTAAEQLPYRETDSGV